MKKQESPQLPLQGHAERDKTGEEYYYVQTLTEHIFLVRRCLSGERKPGPDDPIVRSFDIRHDASSYAESLNDGQRT